MHTPVMLNECLEYLALKPDGVYLDATAGLGGHTGAIARKLAELGGSGFVLACDRDAESLEMAKANTLDVSSRIRFHQSLFSQLGKRLTAETVSQLDGLLADLGVSRYQLTDGGRGFSLMADGPLDMRMGRDIPGDRRRHCQFRIREGTRRPDLRVGRGKEEPKNSQSNRAGTAHKDDRSVGQADRRGRAPHGKNSSRDAHVYGSAHRGEQRAGRAGRAARIDPQAGEAGRTRGDRHLHVARGPQGQTKFSGHGESGPGANSHPARRAACGRGNPEQPTVTKRQAPRA